MYNYGPAFFSEGTSHKLFTGLRLSIITAGIQFQKSTYLAEDDWRTIPFSKVPSSPFQRLLDRMVNIPGLLERVSKLPAATISPKAISVDNLHIACKRLIYELNDWYESYKGIWLETECIDPKFPLDSEYQFVNHTDAHAMILWWTSIIIVHTVAYRLTLYMPAEAGFLPLDSSPIITVRGAALSIIKSINWFLRPEQGIIGRYTIGFSAGVALKYFAPQTRSNEAPYYFEMPAEPQNYQFSPENIEVISWLIRSFKSMNMKGYPIN
ncbi:MAG: hypothetical protein Q9160_003275 [Pyrenula sp. 1 TL-2023]